MANYEGRLEIAFASQPDDPFPVYTDVTTRLRTESVMLATARGRPSELTSVQPATFSCVLENTDGALTPGNTTSPLYPNVKMARRIRYSEVVGWQTIPIFTGWIEFPEIDEYELIGYAEIHLTAVDRLTRLQRGRIFVSMLAEHIRYNGGAALRAYWPCVDPAAPFSSIVNTGQHPPLTATVLTSTAQPASGSAQLIPQQSGSMPSAEDASIPKLTFNLDSGGNPNWTMSLGANWAQSSPSQLGNLTVTPGQVLTVVVWINPDAVMGSAAGLLFVSGQESGPIAAVNLQVTQASGVWQAQVFGGAMTGTINGPAPQTGRPYPVAIRYGYSPSVFELWVDGTVYPGTLSGTPATGNTQIQSIGSGGQYQGCWGHLQAYAGAATDWGSAQMVAQCVVARSGLAYQTTGQRIRTVAQYAGVPTSELSRVDPGTTVMQNASLAGRNPFDAMSDAVNTERGVLFADGAGQLVFQDRRRRYNL